MRCCASWRRCWPRRASTSTTPRGSTPRTWKTRQRALNQAVERQKLARFTPLGVARDLAATTLRRAVAAIVEGDATKAAAILDTAQPESPDDSVATVAGRIGLALGLLDDLASDHDTNAPAGLARNARLPAGHWDANARAPRPQP